MPDSIAIIILNDRTPESTLECLDSLAGEIDDRVRVVVVDNASGDGCADRIECAIEQRGFASWAQLLRAPANTGSAAAQNLGIRSLRADAYLLLNSDARVQPGALRHLRNAMRTRPDAGIIAPALLDDQGGLDHSAFRDPTPQSELLRAAQAGVRGRWLARFQIVLPHSNRPFEPDWVAFASVLIRHELIERIGGLDEDYLTHFEDVDFCRRARAADFHVLYWPGAKVTQLKGGSSQATADAVSRKRGPRDYYRARARYFARYYGRVGLWKANLLWHLGRCLALPRELLGDARPQHRRHEAFDIWTRALRPLQRERAHMRASRARHESGEHEIMIGVGTHNANPADIGLLALITEDFRTHDSELLEPGLWAVVLHRLGNARMDLRPRLLRAPFSLGYRVAFTGVNWLWGIDLSYTVKLGRRVRIWHHGGIVLNAQSIGDDVHIRHNTTFGIARRGENDKKPRIGNRCDIGVGACVLGDVSVGDDCVIGANSVVLHDMPAGTTAVGAPARAVHTTGHARDAEQERERDTPVALHRRTGHDGAPLRSSAPRRIR